MSPIPALMGVLLSLAMAEDNPNFDLSQIPRFKLAALEPLAGVKHGSSDLHTPMKDVKDGPGENASFNDPQDLVLLPDGKGLLVWEWRADAVRRIDPKSQRVTTLFGPDWVVDGKPLTRRWKGKSMAYLPSLDALFLSGDPILRVDLKTGRTSSLGIKGDVAADPAGNRLFVRYTDWQSYLKTGSKFGLLDAASGKLTFLAGGEEAGDSDGAGPTAGFRGVESMSVDPQTGQLYILEFVDGGRSRIRRMDPSGRTETVGKVPGRQRLMAFVVDSREGYLYGFTSGNSLLRLSLKGLAVTGRTELRPPMEGYVVAAIRGERPGEVFATDGMFGLRVWRLGLDLAAQRASESRLPAVAVRLEDAVPGGPCALEVSFTTPPGADIPAGRGSLTLALGRSGLVVPPDIGPDRVRVALGGGAPASPAIVAPAPDGTLRLVPDEAVPAGTRVAVSFRKGVLTCQKKREGGKRIGAWTSAHPHRVWSQGYAIGRWRSGLAYVEGEPGDVLTEVLGDVPHVDSIRPGDFIGPFATHRLMLSFKEGTTVGEANDVLAHIRAKLIGTIASIGVLTLRIPGPMDEAVAWLDKRPKVETAAPDALLGPG